MKLWLLLASLKSRIRERLYLNRGVEGPKGDDFDPPTVTLTARQRSPDDDLADEESPASVAASASASASARPAPVSFLYELAKRWAWEAVAFRCETHPQEVISKEQDFNGDTILHWACFGSPPLFVIQSIVETCPELATIRNGKGYLPLHTACSFRASPGVIRTLVQVFPESAGMAIQSESEQGRSTTSTSSTPLHLLCDYGCPADSLRVILETEWGAASSRKTDWIYRRTPLQILNERKNLNEFHSHLTELRRLQARKPDALLLSQDGQRHDTTMETALLLERIRTMGFWEKAQLLALAEFTQESVTSVEPVRTTVIHAFIGLTVCPRSILEFASFMMPQELMRPDEYGDLPLHFATRCANDDVICDVLRVETVAASVLNGCGQHALQIYLQRDPQRPWNHVVKKLIVASPLAIEYLDIDRRLYPLIWSRLTGTRNDRDALFLSIQGNPSLFAHRA